jgi:hypothetical protein
MFFEDILLLIFFFNLSALIKSFGRANIVATVTNTTVEIIVSEHVFGSVYGEDGGNVDRIRQVCYYYPSPLERITNS